MKFEPGPILFYGGPAHGRVMSISSTIDIVVLKPRPPKFWNHDDGSTEVGVFSDLLFDYRYTPIQNFKIDLSPTGVTNTRSSAFVMMCTARKYDQNKVWRMMERYKIMPGYESVSWRVPQN